MNFRICDAGRERIEPATIPLIEQTFAPAASINQGTEITVAEGERWLAAISVGPQGDAREFLLSRGPQESGLSGRVSRSDALRHFLGFLQIARAVAK